jgi:flagellar motility protein MotE (MotC chaperone)
MPPTVPTAQEQRYDSVEERRILEAIKATGKGQFADEKAAIEQRQKELKRLESEVDKKIDQLNQLRVKVEQLLQQKEAEEQKRVIELAKVYEKMTAEKAAVVLGNLDIPLAVSILSTMKIKSAAKILNNMERDKAAKLTTAFSTLDTR